MTVGYKWGETSHVLTESEMPSHKHSLTSWRNLAAAKPPAVNDGVLQIIIWHLQTLRQKVMEQVIQLTIHLQLELPVSYTHLTLPTILRV